MVSEPVARGSVQVDGSGRLTILFADHQTTGGYPRIATIVGRAADRVAQLQSGTPIRFSPVCADEAITILRRENVILEAHLSLACDRETLSHRLMTRNLISVATVDDD
jgi:5-oxoprolinase (ATP-hydrolysing) subunit C